VTTLPTVPVAAAAEVAVVAVVLVLAVGFLLRRAIRTFAPRDRGGACGCAGTPACPAANAAKDLRHAARRAVDRRAPGRERTAR
jgi:hypothetical protein